MAKLRRYQRSRRLGGLRFLRKVERLPGSSLVPKEPSPTRKEANESVVHDRDRGRSHERLR